MRKSATGSNTESSGLLSLASTLLEESERKRYESDFEFALGNDRIRNIAISGPYGSGKSTVVDSFDTNNEWLHVSLAHFGQGEPPPGEGSETALLNQLVYKIDLSRAPKSRFKKTADRSRAADLAVAGSAVLFALLTVFLGWKFQQAAEVEGFSWGLATSVAIGSWIILACAGIYRLVRTSMIGRALKRLKFVGAELELAEQHGESVFDKCMDDLVYLINNSGYDVVVFEDLDRFNSINLFEKLREVNILANDSRRKTKGFGKNNEPLKFIYLVRDSLFESASDRTKFFDYIIPVIPYVDPNNSFEVLKRGLSAVGINANEAFLYQLSLFVDDSRMLHDVVNESRHYAHSLFENGRITRQGDAERLVSMMSYKIAFPEDYEKLQIRQGYVYALFESKSRLIEQLTEDGKAEREELVRELETIKMRNALSVDELGVLYSAPGFDKIASQYGYSGVPRLYLADPIEDTLEKIRGNKWLRESFDSLVDQLEGNEEYKARVLEAVEDADRRSAAIEARIRDIDTRMLRYRRMCMAELVGCTDYRSRLLELPEGVCLAAHIDKQYEKKVKEDPRFPMLAFFIRRGWIDESYTRFMSNFYAGSMTLRDNEYLVSVLQGSPLDAGFVPDDPKALVMRMDPGILSWENAKNHEVFRELLQNGPAEKLDSLLSGIEKDDDLEYLLSFVCSPSFTERVFPAVEGKLNRPTKRILENESFDLEKKRRFCQKILSCGRAVLDDEATLKTVASFANADGLFLSATAEDAAAMREGLIKIGYKPVDIDVSNSDRGLVKFSYDEGMFAASAALIDSMRVFAVEAKSRLADGALLSDILANDERQAMRAIEADPDLFVRTLLESSVNGISENESAVIWLLSLDAVSEESGKAFVGALSGVAVGDLAAIKRGVFKKALLDANAVECSAENVYGYYYESGERIDGHLAGFIEGNGASIELDCDAERQTIGTSSFLAEAIACNGVSDETLGRIASSYGTRIDDFKAEGLASSRIGVLIDVGSIEMNASTLGFMRRAYSECASSFASKYIDSYIALVFAEEAADGSGCEFRESEAVEIFRREDVPVGKKIELLSGFGEASVSEDYEDELNQAILRSHFVSDEVDVLPALYEGGSEDLKDAWRWPRKTIWRRSTKTRSFFRLGCSKGSCFF